MSYLHRDDSKEPLSTSKMHFYMFSTKYFLQRKKSIIYIYII